MGAELANFGEDCDESNGVFGVRVRVTGIEMDRLRGNEEGFAWPSGG